MKRNRTINLDFQDTYLEDLSLDLKNEILKYIKYMEDEEDEKYKKNHCCECGDLLVATRNSPIHQMYEGHQPINSWMCNGCYV